MFLSHTSDLRAHPHDRSFVAAAEAAVTRAGHAVTDMAYFGARDSEPADHCTRMVAGADVYVGIIGGRYGAPVRGRPELSYTELELETATGARLPRLIFIVGASTTGPMPDGQPADHHARQEAFRRRLLEAGVTVSRVTSPAELELALYQALVELMLARGTCGHLSRECCGRPGQQRRAGADHNSRRGLPIHRHHRQGRLQS